MKLAKTIKTTFTVLEAASVVIAARTIFVPSPNYIFPAALGAIFLLLGMEGLITEEGPTRINLISKQRNKVFFYLTITTYLVLAVFLMQHSHSLWQKR